jgi:hypothetical protein
MRKFFKKYHRWAGLIMAIFLVLFSISGIIMNHRQTFSPFSIDRKYLPDEYTYRDWNLAAVRSSEMIGGDSLLFYGNVGIWLTDTTFGSFTDFNQGLPKGIDQRKTFKISYTSDQRIIAGTLFGMYEYMRPLMQWQYIDLPVHEKNVVDMLVKGDSIFVLTRSHLLLTHDLKQFKVLDLSAPAGYDNKVGLFKTLWVIHSGEIYGQIGKLLVDLVALVFIFLAIGGAWMYIGKRKLKKSRLQIAERKKIKKHFQWHFSWHKKTGWIMAALLLITTVTGMFLRPPLLITIASTKVGKLPHTRLDTPNPWYDILRRIIYLPELQRYVISTSEAFYFSDDEFNSLHRFDSQPPASVMGVNVLDDMGNNTLCVGSFNGLFAWNFVTGAVWDLIDNKPYHAPSSVGSPIGNHKITGHTLHFGKYPMVFDYDKGSLSPFNRDKFPAMPVEVIEKSPLSLWNLSQEIHTGRIYNFLLGPFYILIVPLVGLFGIGLLISGLVMWWRHRKKFKPHPNNL